MKSLLKPLLLCFLFLASAGSLKAQKEDAFRILDNFTTWFTGDFSSLTQAGRIDSTESGLRMHHVFLEAWDGADTTAWVYEEITYMRHPDHVFRQLIWEISELPNGTVVAREYLIKKNWLFRGAWGSEGLLRQMTIEYLADEPLCQLNFDLTNKRFYKGGTTLAGCPNHFRGAVRYTDQASLTETQFDFWERGFDAADKQVWGNQDFGAQFVRTSPEQARPLKK